MHTPSYINEQTPTSFKHKIIFPAIIILISVVVPFLIFALCSPLSLKEDLSSVINNLFSNPGIIGFPADDIFVYILLYATLIAIPLLSNLFSIISANYSKQKSANPREYYQANPFRLIVVYLIIIISAQSTLHVQYFKKISSSLKGKNLIEKRVLIFNFPYIFAYNCKKHLGGKFQGELISDLDFTDENYSTIHRQLAYFLYPINVRFPEEGRKPDCLVYFNKRNAANDVPPGFYIKYQYDNDNLLAVRRGIQ